MFRSLAFLAVLSTVAAVQAIDECNLDTIYSALFDTVGSACVAETGIDTTSPWSPSPEDITAFCGNANCRTVNQRLHDAYPNDCYISSLDTNLLLGLFGDLPCMANTGNTGTSGNTGTTGTTGNTGATGTTGATGPGVAQTGSGCPDGQYPMSVEGVGTIYCVSGLACAGTESKGVCPGPLLPDLPYGSTCGLVRTNVYGCKPFLDASQTTTSEVKCQRAT
ncbi:TPA: hypothetical protein N0F65_008893 [Lagenidium giganteum]|uniref:Uncharacterized protein n=1 Tax=Lagenidium giganteum TaxID=4803 RepID=A0AAV2YYQ9_9STRA|nr:TPA: hypothetical protein N0F65_008893 [Lagenidium giganteum]